MAENRNEISYYLQRARQLGGLDPTQQDPARWDSQGALEQISSAYKFARADETALIDATSQQIKQKRTQYVQELVGVVDAVLGLPLDKVASKEVEQGRIALAKLRRVHPDPGEVAQLEQRWQTFERKISVRVTLYDTQVKLQELWNAPFLILSKYDEALELARRRAREYPDEPEFQQLAQEAEDRRQAAYKKESALTTQAALGRFKALIEETQRLHDNGERELPWYEWDLLTIEGQQVRGPVLKKTVPHSQDPFRHLATMAGEYEDGKADEYLQRAQAALPADPEGAQYWIRLPFEGDQERKIEKFEYWSQPKREELENFRQRQIVPLLEKRKRARDLLAGAIKPGQDPELGWGLVAEATREDPYLAEELEKARGWLRPHLRARWQQELRRAEDQRHEGHFEDAQRAADRIWKLAEGDPELQEVYDDALKLSRRCNGDRDLLAYVEKEGPRIAGLVESHPDEAVQAIADLETAVAGRPLRFQQPLKGPRMTLAARQTLEQRVAGWEHRLQQTDPAQLGDDFYRDATALSQTLLTLGQVLKEIAESGAKGDLVQALKARIAARRHFLQGRAAWEVGRYSQAKEHWQRIKDGDDVAVAREWLARAADASEVTAALNAAKAHQAGKRYDSALRALESWRIKASPLQPDVIKLYSRIEAEYIEALEGQLAQLEQDLEQRPVYKQLVDLVGRLEQLDSSRATTHKAKRFPAIYEEWGDHKKARGDYTGALQDYDVALKWAGEERQTRVARNRRWVRKQPVFAAADRLEREMKWPDAQHVLEELLREYPKDVETLYRLASVALEQRDSQRAGRHIHNAERQLDEAEQASDASQAGLQNTEMAEWGLRLRALQFKGQALAAIVQFEQEADGRLQASHSIGEYRMAREGKARLVERLTDWKRELERERANQTGLFTQYPSARREYGSVCRWLGEQLEEEAPNRHARREGGLIKALEAELSGLEAPDVEGVEFQAAPPTARVKKRWQTGLKVVYLSDRLKANEILSEVLRSQGRLRVAIERMMADLSGPDVALDGGHLEPMEALDLQIAWSENAQAWAVMLRDLLDEYSWAATQEQDSRQDVRTISQSIEEFTKILLALRRCAQDVTRRLESAISAGKATRHHWGRVNWREIVKQILLSSQTPLPTDAGEGGAGSEERRSTYWKELEHADGDRRWMCWGKASGILQALRLSEKPEQAPWQPLDKVIRDAGLEERWWQVLEPFEASKTQFGGHRVVGELIQAKDDAERLRNRLVLKAAELYTAVQAEEFQAALNSMNELEELDQEDKCGFQGRVTIAGPRWVRPLAWTELRSDLEKQQRQWEQFLAWWSLVAGSALHPWGKGDEKRGISPMREQVIRLADEASFSSAIDLAEDAYTGKLPNGRTNALGGGLALEPLLRYLTTLPDELKSPSSWRVERQMREVAQWQHDTAEAVRELKVWLTDIGNRKSD